LDIAQQPGPGVTPLKKVVAQDPVFGEATAKRMFECIDIVNAFADEGSLVEKILIDVRNDSRIRVDARFPS
jgi:hypothetical protein